MYDVIISDELVAKAKKHLQTKQSAYYLDPLYLRIVELYLKNFPDHSYRTTDIIKPDLITNICAKDKDLNMYVVCSTKGIEIIEKAFEEVCNFIGANGLASEDDIKANEENAERTL